MRFHFSVTHSKALRIRARGYVSELRQAPCPEEPHSSFRSHFSLTELLAAATNLSSFTTTGPDKVAYLMLKHLPRSGTNFLLNTLKLFWYLHSFPSIRKTSSIIPIYNMTKPFGSLLPSGLSLSPPASQSFLNVSFYRFYYFFKI